MAKRNELTERERMRALFGINKTVTGDYDRRLAVTCSNGTFIGSERDGIVSYKGIPFAKPPIGSLRWKPPVPAEKGDGVFEALYFGRSPIQTEWASEVGSYYPQSENCLTLNIWSCADGAKEKPVMVFFHGGSYGWGATSDPIYDGHNLVSAHKDVILVTAEYRLGIMGFMDFSEVPGGEDFAESGNLGILDHLCALGWVRENIKAFGGDPENVTVFGESAGGGTVSLLPLIPESKGLFRRVIAQSGSVALTDSREKCKKLTRRLLAQTGAETMTDLMALSEAELMHVNESLNDFNNFPERDGVVLPLDLYGAYKSGVTRDFDIMIGTNSDECRYWIREMGYYTSPHLGKTVFKLGMPLMFNSDTSAISASSDKESIDRYLSLFSARKLWRIVEFYNDILFRSPAIFEAEAHAECGGRSYMYYWTYPSAYKGYGACHAVELAYIFGNLDVTIYTGNNIKKELSEEAQAMWVNFAKTGDPSTERTKLSPYNAKERETVFLGDDISVVSDPFKERRELLEPILKYHFNGCYTNLKINIPLIYKIMAGLGAVIALIPATIIFGISKLVTYLSKKERKRHHQRDLKEMAKEEDLD